MTHWSRDHGRSGHLLTVCQITIFLWAMVQLCIVVAHRNTQ